MYIVTIDTGTTNTRARLWHKGEVLTSSQAGIGVRDTSISGSTDTLKHGIRKAIEHVLKQRELVHGDIGLFLASGMITSNVGLLEIPHIPAPAGVRDVALHMASKTIPEITEKPIWFVPGVKNGVSDVTLENFGSMDIMRGEEVETFGLLDHLDLKGPALFILPGSHSKFVRVDEEGRIRGCVTTLAGELLSVLTTETILAQSLEKSFAQTLDQSMVIKGAEQVRTSGFTRTCFMVRILDQFTETSVNGKANFLAAAIVSTDLLAVKNSQALGDCSKVPIIIGGSNLMAAVFETLVASDDHFRGEVLTIDSQIMKNISGYGAIAAAKARGLCT